MKGRRKSRELTLGSVERSIYNRKNNEAHGLLVSGGILAIIGLALLVAGSILVPITGTQPASPSTYSILLYVGIGVLFLGLCLLSGGVFIWSTNWAPREK